MKIHLIAVKVGVVRIADALVESECPMRSHLDKVAEDTELVKRWLSIEQHDVAVFKVAFDNITLLQMFRGGVIAESK